MRANRDIGAAVIGGGFIGSAHVEALRRLNIPVRGLLGRTADLGSQLLGGSQVDRIVQHSSTRLARRRHWTGVETADT
jgi:hypothetical protein